MLLETNHLQVSWEAREVLERCHPWAEEVPELCLLLVGQEELEVEQVVCHQWVELEACQVCLLVVFLHIFRI